MWDNEKIEDIRTSKGDRIATYYENLKQSGNLKKTAWWVNKLKKGRISGLNQNMISANDFGLCIDSYISCLKEVYGDDWDFNILFYYFRGKTTIGISSILIYYRNIEITNITEITHNIKKLLVSIPFSYNAEERKVTIKCYEKFSGVRLNYSFAEFVSKYAHSHLPSISSDLSRIGFSEFCTGNSDINILPGEISKQSLFGSDFKNYILLYLLTLDSFVKYESIEGRPYLYFDQISENIGLQKYYISFSKEELKNRFKEYLLANKNKISFNYEIVGDKYYLVPDDNYKSFVKKFLVERGYKKELVIKEGNDFFSYNDYIAEHKFENGYVSEDYIFINGNKEFLTVCSRQTEKEDISFYKPSEESLETTKEYIEFLINNKANYERIAVTAEN